MYNWFNYSRVKKQLESQLAENAALREENKNLEDILKSIEEDGTHEHNNAIKLRQENVELLDKIRQLEVAIERWHSRSKEWEKLEADHMDRINEVDSDINREFKAEVFCLKNDYTVLKARHQIVQNDYKKCTEQRDEFKHQLNAANKEIEVLKSKLRDYQDKYAQSFSYNDMNGLQKKIDVLKEERDILKRWKYEQLIVNKQWDKVDDYVRNHDDAPLGNFVANTCLDFLKERDEQKAEIERLKKDIQDYIFEKSDEYNTLKALYERAKKVVEGVEVDLDKSLDEQSDKEPQKHPMYPLHWGGYDKEVEFQGEWKCPCNVCKEDNTSEDKVISDLALRVTKLESQIKNLTSSCRDI